MNGKELFLGLSYINPKYIDEAKDCDACQSDGKHIRFRKPLLIAAVIALTLLLVGCAVAAYARIHIKLVQHNVPTAAQTEEEVPDTTPVRSVIASCYPQQLPEGYRLAEGSPLNHTTRNICYRNEAGETISFTISTSQAIEGVLAPPREETSLTVSGWDAVLQTSEKGAQMLSWHDEAEGYYAGLFTQDMAVDLKAMAESVDSGEELPMSFLCRQGEIWNIWYPRQIPEGYTCTDVAPCGNGGQEVRYTCEESGSVISYHVSLTTDLSEISDPPHDSGIWEDLTVAGQPARMMTTSSGLRLLFWENEQEGFNAMLSVEDPAVDILAMAESVAPGEPLEVTSNYLGPDYTIKLEQDASYVGWEPVYPQRVPEGYEITFVAEPAYGEQSIDYENDAGDTLTYTLYFRLSQWGRQFDGMGQPEQVKINGNVGYRSQGELIWTDEAKGFGFSLHASGDVDLIAVAESVGIGPELKPTRWEDIQKALEQLGDYQITALPDGMAEDGLTGAPLETGDDWYSYVRRWYFDPKTNQDIYLEYESYVTDCSGMEDVLQMLVGAGGNPVTIQGCTGAALQNGESATVVWLTGTPEKGTSFRLSSSSFTTEELLPIAESVQLQ